MYSVPLIEVCFTDFPDIWYTVPGPALGVVGPNHYEFVVGPRFTAGKLLWCEAQLGQLLYLA